MLRPLAPRLRRWKWGTVSSPPGSTELIKGPGEDMNQGGWPEKVAGGGRVYRPWSGVPLHTGEDACVGTHLHQQVLGTSHYGIQQGQGLVGLQLGKLGGGPHVEVLLLTMWRHSY